MAYGQNAHNCDPLMILLPSKFQMVPFRAKCAFSLSSSRNMISKQYIFLSIGSQNTLHRSLLILSLIQLQTTSIQLGKIGGKNSLCFYSCLIYLCYFLNFAKMDEESFRNESHLRGNVLYQFSNVCAWCIKCLYYCANPLCFASFLFCNRMYT